MDSKKAERFEKHRKELRKKAFLNIAIVLLVATGIGFYAGGYAADFLMILAAVDTAVIFSMAFVFSLVILWVLPILNYRERVEMKSSASKDHYMNKSLEESPLIQMLEESGWEEEEASEEKVVLTTHATMFHKILGKESKMMLEREEASEGHEIHLLKRLGEDIARIKTEYSETEEGLEITETTVSLSRVSPVYIEVTMFLMPEIQEMAEDTAEEDLETVDEEVDYRFKPYELE